MVKNEGVPKVRIVQQEIIGREYTTFIAMNHPRIMEAVRQIVMEDIGFVPPGNAEIKLDGDIDYGEETCDGLIATTYIEG